MDTSGDCMASISESQVENDENYRRSITSLHKSLRQETLCNVEVLKSSTDVLPFYSAQIYSVFCQLFDHLDNIDGVLLVILDFAPKYDFKNQRVNGYRSLVKVTQRLLTRLTALVRHISVNKDSYLFRKSHYLKELESYVMALGQMRDVLHYARKLKDYCPKEDLIPAESLLDTEVVNDIQMEIDNIDQEWFYGRALGFQYCDSLKKSFEVVHISLATYSHNYQTSVPHPYIKLAGSLLTSGQYVLNPEHRAQKVVEVTLGCDIEFCKAFWGLTETDLLHKMASLALPTSPINHVFTVDTDDILLTANSGQSVCIKSPSAHIGRQQLQLRIISHAYRLGQEMLPGLPQQTLPAAPPSKYLIIQCHGGGFVSQTSRTHEAYLRHWARDLRVPILCVDYSLAPAAPFPRALEEVYYAYAWALTNKHKLGTTAEKVVLVGDSAGGNLLLASMLRAIEDDIRLPDGIVAVYTPVYIQFVPSPSRTLSVMDALLPVGILTKCLEAYAGDHIEPWKVGNNASTTSVSKPMELSSPDKHSTTQSDKNNLRCSPVGHEDEDDEEIKSYMLDNPDNPQLAVRQNSSESDAAVNRIKGETVIKHISHKRLSHISHTRGGSMPLAPKIQPVISRHDKNRHFAQSPLYKFSKIRIRQNPYLSPMLASDELLSKMPSIYLVACHMDPCLDDSVTFAKKLDSLGVDVYLDAIDEVPHGFLNFGLVSNECMQATDLCRDRLRDALGIDEEYS